MTGKTTRNQIKKKLHQITAMNWRLASDTNDDKFKHIYQDIAYLAKFLSILERDGFLDTEID